MYRPIHALVLLKLRHNDSRDWNVVSRRWTVQHDEAMRQLVIVLQEQCEKYFEDIRPHAQKV